MKQREIQVLKYKELLERNGWNKYFNVDLLDKERTDKVLEYLMRKVLRRILLE